MNIAITGAGKGIGFSLVKKFLSAGHHVWACSRQVDALENLHHPNLRVVALDLVQTDQAEIRTAFSSRFEHLDVLVHNAGHLLNQSFETTTLDEWRQVFEVNFFAAVKVSQALMPFLRKSEVAHIVHIGSMGGFQGASKFPGLSAYSASKAALANLTECMAEELKQDGIHVNCLALGAVNTEMLRQAFPGYVAPVNSEDIASFIYSFCLDQRAFFNGKILPVSSTTP